MKPFVVAVARDGDRIAWAAQSTDGTQIGVGKPHYSKDIHDLHRHFKSCGYIITEIGITTLDGLHNAG